MNRLGEKSLKTLEYYEILERLAAQAASEAAKEKCRALRAGRPRAGGAVDAPDHGREGPHGAAGQPVLRRHP